MAHIRKQIRDSLKALLSSVPDIGGNIIYDDPNSINGLKLPVLAIHTAGERVENLTIGVPRLQQRTLQLDLMVLVKQMTDLQDKLDEVAHNIEVQLASNIDLNGLIMYHSLNNIQFEFNDDTDKYIGSLKMEYDFIYQSYEGS